MRATGIKGDFNRRDAGENAMGGKEERRQNEGNKRQGMKGTALKVKCM